MINKPDNPMALFILAELERKGDFTSEEDRLQFVALLIQTEFPDASSEAVHNAITAVNAHIRAGGLAPPPGLRPIEGVSIADLDIGEPLHGEPICERIDPRTLFVDPRYQRDIRERGLRQIRQIIEGFDWNRFKPPICAYAEHGGKTVLKVLDGQHTAIACASHPAIELIPVMIVEAASTTEQAASFVGQNVGHLAVTPLQLHRSALVSQDEDAVTVDQVCSRAGITILATTPKKYNPGDTVAVSAIRALVDRRGAMKARIVLEVLAKAEFAPVAAPQIKAVELLLTDQEYKDAIAPEDLTEAIGAGKLVDHDKAKELALAQRWPFWKALAITWFRKCKKRRAPAGRAA